MARLLAIAFCLLTCSFAHAQDLRFGVRFGLDLASPVAFAVRAEFGDGDGFGVRAVAGTILIIGAAETMVYYRFGSDERGSSGYVGMGGGVLAVIALVASNSSGPFVFVPYIAGLIGYAYRIDGNANLFAELRPALLLGGSPNIPTFLPLFALGLNVWF